MRSENAATGVMDRLATHKAEARSRDLPENMICEAEHRILDTMAAVVSGAALKPGRMALDYVRTLGGAAEAQVVGSDIVTCARNSALANGMLGNTDESDDTHMPTKCHPGCSIAPAALPMAECESADWSALVRAVTLGYDLCCRMVRAMDGSLLQRIHRSTQGIGSTFGATGAAACPAGLDAT